MIYGLYLSATGVLTNAYRQDVIANNLANAETVGFKRSLATFQQRLTEAQRMRQPDKTNPELENIGGGMMPAPTYIDHSQGSLEETHGSLDVALHGRGFFAVRAGNTDADLRLTRNGQFLVDKAGYLTLADGSGHRVLDAQRRPIQLAGIDMTKIEFKPDGTINAGNAPIAKLGIFDVPDEAQLMPRGSTLMSYPGDLRKLPAATNPAVAQGFVERSNVDPMIELTQLIDAQRQLEANANMIRYQDQTLGKLVNEVGKIS